MTVVPAPGTPGYEYQLAHWDDDLRPQSIAGCAVMVAASTVSVGLRMTAQKLYAKGWGLADWLIVVAWVIAAGITATAIVCYAHGFGLHQLRVILSDKSPPRDLTLAFENGLFVAYAWVPCLALIKLSLLLYYNQLFHVNQKWLKFLSWIMAAYVIAWAIACTPVLLFSCAPVSYFWERMALFYGIKTPAATNGHCQPQLVHLAAPSITSTISDCVILIIPMVILSKLEMAPRRKIGLILLFSLGAFVVATGVVRIYYVFHVSNEEDVTWNDIGTVVWTVVETNLGIVCACIPPSMPLLTACYKRLFSQHQSLEQKPAARRYAFGSRHERRAKRFSAEEALFHDSVALKSNANFIERNGSAISDLEAGEPQAFSTPAEHQSRAADNPDGDAETTESYSSRDALRSVG